LEVVLYIILAYLVIGLLAYLVQERFIFKPEKLPPDFEFRYEAPFKEISFSPEPGVTISGIHFQVPRPLGVILYFHGNTRSIKGWGKYARDFYRFGYDVVLVDYRGFGKSTGKRSERAMLQDMQFVYDRLVLQYPEDHIRAYLKSVNKCKNSSLKRIIDFRICHSWI
jgi:pimeloyl-ACP methyl ester carboxylesterase